MTGLDIRLPSWATRFNRSVLQKKIRLLGLTALELTIIFIMTSSGVTALVATRHQSSLSASSSTNTRSPSAKPQTHTKQTDAQSTSPSSTPPTSSSSSGSTATKSPAPTTSTPSVTVPTVNACNVGATNDATARSSLAHEYYIIGDEYITNHVNSDAAAVEADPSSASVAANAIFDLNSVISLANSQYAQSYNGYVSERQQYHCTVTVSAPVSIPSCATTGENIVANCISNINANLPTAPTW